MDYLKESQVLIQDAHRFQNRWKEYLHTDCLHVEIGCGKGNYSLGMSKLYREDGFVAIEKNDSAAGVAAKKYDLDTEKGKLCLIHGDASELTNWFGRGEIDVIHLNFSDPWPKKRYAKRRLSSDRFLEQYQTVLAPDGEIQMKTDNAKLFAYSLLAFQNAGLKMTDIDVDFRKEKHDDDVMTEYEEKFVLDHQPIYRCVWKRENKVCSKKSGGDL